MTAAMDWGLVWVGIIVATFTSAVTGAVSYVKWILPRRKEKEARDHQLELGWFGRPGVPGVSDDVIAMPLRVDGVEKGLVQVRDSVDGMAINVDSLASTVKESNGFVKEVRGMVASILHRTPGVTLEEASQLVTESDKATAAGQAGIIDAIAEHGENGK